MEFDRYKEHHKLYILGIICLILCLTLLFFCIYILPFLIWGLHYDTPDFLSYMISYFEYDYSMSYPASATLVWLIFFIPGLVTAIISYVISNYIDNILIEVPVEEEIEKEQSISDLRNSIKESSNFGFKILILMVLVVCGILLIQALLYLNI